LQVRRLGKFLDSDCNEIIPPSIVFQKQFETNMHELADARPEQPHLQSRFTSDSLWGQAKFGSVDPIGKGLLRWVVEKVFCRLLLSVFFAYPATGLTILVNGNFETGDFTGWTQSGWFIDTSLPNSGVYDTATGCPGASCTTVGDPNSAFLFQTVTTSIGTVYNLSFFYNSGASATSGSELLVLWGDPSAPNLSQVVDFQNVDTSGAYVQYTGNVTATSTTSELEFLGRQDLDFYRLDDVLLNAPAPAVPEPGAGFLFFNGFILLCVCSRARTPLSFTFHALSDAVGSRPFAGFR